VQHLARLLAIDDYTSGEARAQGVTLTSSAACRDVTVPYRMSQPLRKSIGCNGCGQAEFGQGSIRYVVSRIDAVATGTVWHSDGKKPLTLIRDKPMFEGLTVVRKAIEDRAAVIDEARYELRVVGITEHPDGGVRLVIAISGRTGQLQIDVSENLLHDPIAVRQRVVHFVRQILTGHLPPSNMDP
jgi:hypothetical protein